MKDSMYLGQAAERRKNLATAEGRGSCVSPAYEPRSGGRFFRRSAAHTAITPNHGLQPWLGSCAALRLGAIGLLIWFVASTAFAQAPVRLTLDDATTMALANHP